MSDYRIGWSRPPLGVFAQAFRIDRAVDGGPPLKGFLNATGHSASGDEREARAEMVREMKRHLEQHKKRLAALASKVREMEEFLALESEGRLREFEYGEVIEP